MARSISDAIEAYYGLDYDTQAVPADYTIGAAPSRIADDNAQRFAIVVANNGASAIYVGLDASVSTATGIPIAPGATMSLDFREDFHLAARGLWAVAAVAGQAVHVQENRFI